MLHHVHAHNSIYLWQRLLTQKLPALPIALFAAIFLLTVNVSRVQAGIYNSDTDVTYKEYWINHNQYTGGCENTAQWYIEPGTQYSACTKTLTFNLPDDFSQALKLELVIDLWRNHGEKSARFQLNTSPTVYIPSVGDDWSRTPYITEIPKSELVQGANTIKFWNTQNRLFHVHDVVLRIYYDAGHPLIAGSGSDVTPPSAMLTEIVHDNGSKSPSAGGNLVVDTNSLTLKATASGGAQYIEFHAFYEGYDEDNDGVFRDWHNTSRMNCNPGGYVGVNGCYPPPPPLSGTIGHIATVAPGSPETVAWNLAHITNQAGVRFKVRAVDAAGNVFEGSVSAPFKLLRNSPTAAFVNTNFQSAGLYMGNTEAADATRTLVLPSDITSTFTLNNAVAYLIGAHWEDPFIKLNTSPQFEAFYNNEDTWGLSIRQAAGSNPNNNKMIYYVRGGTNTFIYSHRANFGEFVEKPGPMLVLRSTTIVQDTTPPVLTGQNPAANATGVDVNTAIVLHLTDYGSGVDRESIVMTVEGSPVTPIISGFSNDYTLTYTPPSPFPYSTVVDISISADDLKGNVLSTSYSFTTRNLDSTPPVISNVQVIAFTTSARITWSTDKVATSLINYGLTSSYGSNVTDNTLMTQHVIVVSGLSSGVEYHYQIISANLDGYPASTADATFTTPVPGPVASDNFNACALNTNLWEFVNPRDDATVTLVNGQKIKLSVPAGIEHDAYPKSGQTLVNRAPRIMQNATDPDDLKVKFESGPDQPNLIHGIVVEQDEANFLRINLAYNGAATQLQVYKIINGVAQSATAAKTVVNGVVNNPIFLIVTFSEVDSKWRIYWDLDAYKPHSHDGNTAFFTHALSINKIGVFAANAGNNPPAHEVVADYVSAPSAPLFDEDDTAPLVLPVGASPVSAGVVTKNINCGNPVQVTMTANPGWTFSHWDGVASGTANPQEVAYDFGDFAVAYFIQNQYTLSATTTGNGTVTVSPVKSSYSYGEQVTLTANPAYGWQFAGWSNGSSNNPLVINMSGGQVINATFTQPQYTLTLNQSAGGEITLSPDAGPYAPGELVTLLATPNAGWSFGGWSGDFTSSAPRITLSMNGNKSLTATFTQNRYQVSLSTDGAGSAAPSPSQSDYAFNELVVLSATPSTGWRFVHWDGGVISATNPAMLMVNGNAAVSATFVQDRYILQADTVGLGAVAVSPNKTGYLFDEIVTLTATPGQGWLFNGWAGALSGNTNPIQLSMTSNKLVTAIFTQQQFSLSKSQQGSGTIVVNPDKATYGYGDQVTVTAQPEAGWHFTGWSGDLSGDMNPATLVMTGAKNIVAEFSQTPLTLATSVVGNGTVNVDPQQESYSMGKEVELTAIPTPGWIFSHWSGDLTGSKNPAKLTMNADKNVVANFVEGAFTLAVNPSAGGLVARNPDKANYLFNEEVTLNAVPNAGFTFVGWSGDLTGSQNPTTIRMDKSKTINALFTQAVYNLNRNVSGRGSVLVSPPKNTFVYGEQAVLSAVPRSGWRFSEWVGDVTGSTTPVTVIVTSHMSVTAIFLKNTGSAQLTVHINGQGEVKAKNANGDLVALEESYPQGAQLELVALPAADWEFVNWTGDLSSTQNPVVLDLDGDKTITVNFSSPGNNLTILVSGNGTVTTTEDAGNFVLTALPAVGWQFSQWSGGLSGSVNPAIVTVGTSTVITATFTPKQYTLDDHVAVEGNGHVEFDPAGPYKYGDQVMLTAVPDTGWKFIGWEVLDSVSEAQAGAEADPELEIIITDENKIFKAKFALITLPVYLPLVQR